MKNILFISFILFCVVSCGEPNDGTIVYEYWVENQLSKQTVKIVPTSKTDYFWISSSEYYIVVPGEKIIIGSKTKDFSSFSFGPQKAKDIYKPNDIIVPFDVYVDDEKLEKTLSISEFWKFSSGKVKESGKYTLVINENTLNN